MAEVSVMTRTAEATPAADYSSVGPDIYPAAKPAVECANDYSIGPEADLEVAFLPPDYNDTEANPEQDVVVEFEGPYSEMLGGEGGPLGSPKIEPSNKNKPNNNPDSEAPDGEDEPRSSSEIEHDKIDSERQTQKYTVTDAGIFPTDKSHLPTEERDRWELEPSAEQKSLIEELQLGDEPATIELVFKTEVNPGGQKVQHISVQVLTPLKYNEHGQLEFQLTSEMKTRILEEEEDEPEETTGQHSSVTPDSSELAAAPGAIEPPPAETEADDSGSKTQPKQPPTDSKPTSNKQLAEPTTLDPSGHPAQPTNPAKNTVTEETIGDKLYRVAEQPQPGPESPLADTSTRPTNPGDVPPIPGAGPTDLLPDTPPKSHTEKQLEAAAQDQDPAIPSRAVPPAIPPSREQSFVAEASKPVTIKPTSKTPEPAIKHQPGTTSKPPKTVNKIPSATAPNKTQLSPTIISNEAQLATNTASEESRPATTGTTHAQVELKTVSPHVAPEIKPTISTTTAASNKAEQPRTTQAPREVAAPDKHTPLAATEAVQVPPTEILQSLTNENRADRSDGDIVVPVNEVHVPLAGTSISYNYEQLTAIKSHTPPVVVFADHTPATSTSRADQLPQPNHFDKWLTRTAISPMKAAVELDDHPADLAATFTLDKSKKSKRPSATTYARATAA